MTRHFWKIVCLSVVAACGTALPEGEVQPIRKVLADTRSQPFECLDYEAKSDSCTVLAHRRVSGDRILYDVSMLVSGPRAEALKLTSQVDFKIEGDRYCGDMRNADVRIEGDLNTSERSLIEEVVLAEMISAGVMCGVYYKDGAQYLGVTTDRAGRVLPDGVDRIHFFKGPKRLRL